MFRNTCHFIVGLMLCNHMFGQDLDVYGLGTNGLQPVLQIERANQDWYVQIDYKTQTNVAWRTWLMISNKVGAKLSLCQTNGVLVPLLDTSAKAAWSLPIKSTASDVFKGVETRRRASQWWGGVRRVLEPGRIYPATGFRLTSAFGISLTNDFILSVSPLMYKVETNMETAHLIEFPTIRVKLKGDGTVEKLE
jgi:hypothetical protein